MNASQLKGEWKVIKGNIRSKWGKFTDDQLEEFRGDMDKIVGQLQKVYGLAKEEAEKQYKDFKSTLNQSLNQADKHHSSEHSSERQRRAG